MFAEYKGEDLTNLLFNANKHKNALEYINQVIFISNMCSYMKDGD